MLWVCRIDPHRMIITSKPEGRSPFFSSVLCFPHSYSNNIYMIRISWIDPYLLVIICWSTTNIIANLFPSFTPIIRAINFITNLFLVSFKWLTGFHKFPAILCFHSLNIAILNVCIYNVRIAD